MKGLPLTFILIMPRAVYALDQSSKDMPDYTLQVSFDVKPSTIRDVATIPVINGQELRLYTCLAAGDLTGNKRLMREERTQGEVEG